MSDSPDAPSLVAQHQAPLLLSRPPHLHLEHFQVAPSVAPRPLALRRQRLFAMLIDLALVGLVSTMLSSLRVLFTALFAVLLYWGLGRLGLMRSSGRRAVVAGITFCTLLALAFAFLPDVPDDDEREARDEARELAEEATEDAAELQIERALAQVGMAPPAAPTADATERELTSLRHATAVLEERVESLEEQLEEAKNARGILHFVKASASDLGFGVGWSYVYFIGFLTLWNGLTPGKRLLGIRAVRIDGKPFSLWRAWERFHGYAASMITGLLGFAQILWDPNRQCLHDKVAETVVVRD